MEISKLRHHLEDESRSQSPESPLLFGGSHRRLGCGGGGLERVLGEDPDPE